MCPPGPRSPSSTLCLFDLLAADEEAALCLQHQRRVGRLHILECLRHHVDGRAENARQGNTDHDGRSNQHHESLTSHVQSPLYDDSNGRMMARIIRS